MEAVKLAFENALIQHRLECPVAADYQRMEAVQRDNTQGINNFRKFQLDMTGKINFVHGAAWAWSVVLTLVLAFFIWAFSQVYPAIRLVMADYYMHHPTAQIQREKHSFAPQQVYTARRNLTPSVAQE